MATATLKKPARKTATKKTPAAPARPTIQPGDLLVVRTRNAESFFTAGEVMIAVECATRRGGSVIVHTGTGAWRYA